MAWQAILGAGLQLAGGAMQAEAGDIAIRGKMEDMDSQIASMMQQAGWERDYGDRILDQTNKKSKRMKRVAYKQAISMMDKANQDAMLAKAESSRASSSMIASAAGAGADVGYGSPIEAAALQLEVGEREANMTMSSARDSVKSIWDDVKWETDEMKSEATYQKKMSYRKAESMEGTAGQIKKQKGYLEASRKPQYFATMLGAGAGALSSYTSLNQVYDKPDKVEPKGSYLKKMTKNYKKGQYNTYYEGVD